MRPVLPKVKYKHSVKEQWRDVAYAEKQDQYITLPSLKKKGDSGEVVTMWKLSWRERIKLLFTGTLWLSVMTFGNKLQPVQLEVDIPEV